MSETERQAYHDGVLYGIRHPGPSQVGCTYCDSTLRQRDMIEKWLGPAAPAPAGDSGGEGRG